jgi:predicted 3-demethylubiquinone-9 3-methyltransferase (glyoxalase superfamily)
VSCKTQDDIDDYWAKLGAGGNPKAQQCGWQDPFGVSFEKAHAS